MGAPDAPSADALAEAWRTLRALDPDAPDLLDAAGVEMFRDLWPLIGTAEAIMATGGDVRLLCDPVTALNGYGCSHRPRPWAITFASSTASSVSERGYAAADKARRRITAAMLAAGERHVVFQESQHIRGAITRYFGLPKDSAVVLAASGTDSELLALALTHLAEPERPVLNILLAPEETGSGVPVAAVGRHFAVNTAGGQDVNRETLIEGFRPDTILHVIPLRDGDGLARPARDVATAITDAVEHGVAAGRRVILHALDLSKTGLLAPGIGLLCDLRARFGNAFDIVVDACQMRLSPERVRAYLALDAVVQITGSKFFTGPPFTGAALLPPAIAARLARGRLPAGLDAYFGRGEWLGEAETARQLRDSVNYGLALRWRAALAEMSAFAAVPEARTIEILDRFAETVAVSIARHGIFALQSVPPLTRDSDGWDASRSIFAFAVRAPFDADRFMGLNEARKLYQWLNADCSVCFSDAASRALAARICHIGQPVALSDGTGTMGLLRVSAGARLVSGEPSHRGLYAARRLDREMTDLAAVFDKIALLRPAWARVAAANPLPRYWAAKPPD